MRTEYSTHDIHIFFKLQCAVSCDGFDCPLSFSVPPFFPSSTRPLHVQLFALLFVFPVCTRHSTFLVGLIPPLGHVLRFCFQSQLTFHNLEFPNTSHFVDICFDSKSFNLNIVIDVIMIWDVTPR